MTPAQASSLNAASYMIRRMLLHAGISGFSSPSISFEGMDGEPYDWRRYRLRIRIEDLPVIALGWCQLSGGMDAKRFRVVYRAESKKMALDIAYAISLSLMFYAIGRWRQEAP